MAYRSQEFCCLFSLASLQHAMSQTPSIASKIHHDVWTTSTSFSSILLCLSTLPQFYFYPTPLLLCKDSFSVMLYWFFGNFIPHTLILFICQFLYIHISFLHYVPTNKLQTKLNKTNKNPTYLFDLSNSSSSILVPLGVAVCHAVYLFCPSSPTYKMFIAISDCSASRPLARHYH